MAKKKRRKNPDQPIEEFDYKGYTVKIYPDQDPESPREWDNLGRILYFKGSGRYKLGDETATIEEMNEIAENPDAIALPVYTMIHSGIAMKTTPFGDPWDSGQSGIIYTWAKKALKAFNRKRMTPALRKKVEKMLAQEVETFGEYLNGEVYGYVIEDPEGSHVDSLWGIMPFDYAKEAATDAIDSMVTK